MDKIKVSDEEFAELESVQRHDDIMNVLRLLKVPNHSPDFERLGRLITTHHDTLATALKQKKVSTDLVPFIAELKPVLAELRDLKRMLNKPKSFRVERGKLGLIERIVVE